jgi:phosphoribosylcarboxyaminoimidazole (NCAIR) mutase
MSDPIDRGTVSVPAAIAVAAVAITAAVGWNTAIVRIEAAEKELKQHAEAINEQTETLDAICERLQCRREGLRRERR